MPVANDDPASRWDLPIESPLIVDPENHPWDDAADLVVVGLGGAGVAAATEALEHGASVIALDNYGLGGSTAANGGVFYAGGGTAIQREADEIDTPEEMFNYLRIEVGGVVEDSTLRRFCNESVETVDWLLKHGAKLSSAVCKDKTSYPPLDKFLYHSDSSLAAPYAKHAKPAARGHRGFTTNGKKAWGLGGAIYDPLRAAALRLGMRFSAHAQATQLAVDVSGRVIGVKALVIPANSEASASYAKYIAAGSKWMGLLPPSFPLAGLTQAIGQRYLAKAKQIESKHRVARWYRARHGVLLSTGGFVMNRTMVAELAPKYLSGMPLGTLGDTGTGIGMGVSAGGSLGLAERVSAWRFINPPLAWARGALVNAQGARFVNEMLYGASIGDAMVERNDGKAWIILDARLRREAKLQAKDPQTVPFQRDVAMMNLRMNAKKAPTLDALADRIGFDRATLAATIASYNRAARGEIDDAFEKRRSECAEIAEAPFYAIDASIDSRWLPLPTMTVGGLRVDELSGRVKRDDGSCIAGLYAAGRTAVGICSNIYVSGLSYADCVFSGRRVARDIAAALSIPAQRTAA
jgi:3-oxo-5alpha-steroid 4-dehydrogenase